MANVKISALPAATTVAASDLLPVVQGGATKQTTPDLLPLSAAAVAALAAKAGLVSPAFTGAPTIGGTAVAKTSDITAAVNALIGGASTAYDTLGELATQLASDENAAAALTTLVGQKSLSLPVNVITPTGGAVKTAVIGARNSVDASTGPITVALPTPTAVGQHLILERADASAVTANAITVTGTIRNAPSNVVLNAVGAAFEGALYIAESLTSWAIAASIKPRAVLDAAYDAKGAATAAVAAQATTDAATYVPLATFDAKGPSQTLRVMRQYRSQLARRESTPLDLVFMGHSLVEGEGATAMTKRGVDRLKSILRTQFQPAGITGGYGYIPVSTTGLTTWSLSSYITVSGGAYNGNYGLGGHSYFVNASGAKVILNTIACDAIDVLYVQGGGGTFTTKVDGVANSDSIVTTGSPVALKRYRVPGITAGNHSVEVDFVSGNSIIAGFMVYNGDASAGGLRFWTDAQGGATSTVMQDTGNVKFAGLDVIPNPVLVTITAFANDFKTGIPVATSKANLQALVTQVRVKAPNASIVFAIEHALGSTGAVIPWSQYVQQYYDVAAADGNIAVFDFYQRIGTGTPPTAAGMIYTDQQHYTDAGYLMWADALAGFLAP